MMAKFGGITSQTDVSTTGGAGELAYAQITANVSVTATVEATADSVVAAPALTFDGTTPVLIEFCASAVVPGGGSVTLLLYQDGTSLGFLAWVTAASAYIPVFARRRITPTAGNHTYSIKAITSGGTGLVMAGNGTAGNYSPAHIRITRAT